MISFFESEILKGKHFPKNSRDRLRATLVNMFMIFGSFIILMYAYENLQNGYYGVLALDLIMVAVMVIGYLIFPYYIDIHHLSYMMIGVSTFVIAMSFVLHGMYPELSLFWFASLPVFVFYFLGMKEGIKWNAYLFTVIVSLPLISYIFDVKLVYEWKVISQILFGFLVITYMLYIVERERSSYETRLNDAIEENKMLLKEVHHRTKNNLQVIMSLLESQSLKIENPKYKRIFESHIDRLKAMSLMHKNLYVNKKFGHINIKQYLEEIIKSLKAYTQHNIYSQIEDITIDMKSAMNIGLIVNEAVSNSIEHAFGDDMIGTIDVVLENLDDRFLLLIKDNGKGFDTDKMYNSLGVTLINDLATTLPNYSIYVNGEYGTVIRIYFDIEGVKE